jgi:RNA polymerase sigma factor (sigma-70 family)
MLYDDGDREDLRRLEEGDLAALLAKYHAAVLGRCVAKLRNDDAEDVAQNVMVRIVREWEGGKRWQGVPFRVVVHQVTSWTIGDYFDGRKHTDPLPEDWDPGPGDWTDDVLGHDLLMTLFAQLTPRQQKVATLHFVGGLGSGEIAERLETTGNAIDQELFRIRRMLREVLVDPHG